MRRRTVALVIPDYRSSSTPHGGGLGTVVEFLRTALASSGRYEGHVVSVATSRSDSASRRVLAPRSLVRRSLRQQRANDELSFPHFGANLVEAEPQRYRPRRELTQYLEGFDVVQIVAGSPALATIARDVTRPVCLQVATLIKWERAYAMGTPGRLTRGLITSAVVRMDERALGIPSRIFVENPTMHAELARLGCPAVLAPPGVDTDFFHPGAPKAEDPYILTVGRLDDPRKNLALLIRAYGRLTQVLTHPPRLVLAGQTPPASENLELIASLGIASQVSVVVGASAVTLRDLYQGAAAFVLASHEEGLGLVVVEAIACGLPVVSTRTAGTEAILADPRSGRLVDQGPAAEGQLAEALVDLLNRPETARDMGQVARRVALERYSLTAAERPFLAAYDELTS